MAGNLTAMMASIFRGGVTADPFFEYTTLLLPGNGTNGAQNNTFLDGSTNNFTITRNGNTTQGTFSPFSQTGWGNYFNGSSRLSSTTGNVLNWGTNNFTVEMWVYLTTTSSNMMLLEGPSNNDFQLFVESGILKAGFVGAGVSVSYTLPSTFANTWNHIAVVRSGTSTNQTALYVNGVSQSTGTWSSSGAATGFQIARTSAYTLYGYVSGVRVIQNQALTSGNFTPPTAQVTTSSVGWTGANVAGSLTGTVSLLLCTSNRFVDSSGTVSTITIGGSPSVQAFSPFNPTASWSAATYGGSGYFDGSTDYLNVTSPTFTLGTSNLTAECWFYPTAAGNSSTILACKVSGGAGFYFVWASTSNAFRLLVNAGTNWNVDASTSALNLNSWNHLVMTRDGTTVRTFLNGVLATVTTGVSGSMGATAPIVKVGADDAGSGVVNACYMTDTRIIVGSVFSAYQTSSTTTGTQIFTPPTAPLTNATDTKLLLNFTNAGIYDATSKNDLETVGDAQISTAQSKFGGSSIYFAGTDDYIVMPINPLINFTSSGSITIELWVYTTSTSRQFVIGSNAFNSATSNYSAGIILDWTPGTSCLFAAGRSTGLNLGSGVTANNWHHLAFVYNGPTTTNYVFLNGSLITSSVSSSAMTQTGALLLGVQGSDRILDYTGYIQDLRISNIARYTGNFTAPTAAFPTL